MDKIADNGAKPRVLILGGCGFIGRNLVAYLTSNQFASAIRIVDKVPPQVAWLSPEHEKLFDDPIVEFKSANLINTASCESAFATENGDGFDYVINCAGETKPNQTDPVYREGIWKLSINVATQAANCKAKHYVELSSGNMYSSEKIAHKEDGPVEPWTSVAKWKSQVEQELKNIPGLNFTVLRPAVVYGTGDRLGLAPRILVGAIYKHLGETMKLLWSPTLKLNTIHVSDVCRAIWFVCGRGETVGHVYNLVDAANSTQGSITGIVADIFDIQYDYLGSVMSKIIKTDMANVVDEVNDKHLVPWAEACKRDGVDNTPLTPYMSEESLYDRHVYLDGSALEAVGFKLAVPEPTKELLQQIVTEYVAMNVFPPSLVL